MDNRVVWSRVRGAILAVFTLGVAALAATSASGVQSVTLEWSPSSDANVTGYNIYYGVASRVYTNKIDVGNLTNATVSGLIEGVTYYFAATAYNVLGIESDFSGEVWYTVPGVSVGNNPPTLDPISNVTIDEGAGTQAVSLSGIGSGSASETQPLSVVASSSNPGLIPNPAVLYTSPNTTAALTFAPVPNEFGSADITVTVDDGQLTNHSIVRTFTVTVNPINAPPTLNAMANLVIDEDAGIQTVNLSGISAGPPNENQVLTVTASSSNPGLIPNPTVSYSSPNSTGTITFAPQLNASGSATITVTVNDGQTANNSATRTFTVAVNSVNDTPTLDVVGDITVNEDSGAVSIPLSGISSGAANENQTLTVTATSSDTALVPNPAVTYASPNVTGTLVFKPTTNAYGTTVVTVRVSDGQAVNGFILRSFTITVNPVNDTPTLNALGNLSIAQNAGLQTVALSGISAGAPNEIQTLAVSATSSDPGLILNPVVRYTSPGTTGTLTFTPVAGASGTATIAVTVDDGQGSNSTFTRSFIVNVNGGPMIAAIPDQTISVNSNTGPIGFVVGDGESSAGSLALKAVSSAPALIPTSNIVFGGSSSNRTVKLTPIAGRTGTATISIIVSDGTLSSSTTFLLTVLPTPTPPADLMLVTNGAGTVSGAASVENGIVGKVYSLTAVPAAGQEFAGWTGSIKSQSPKISILMSTNLHLEANFVPSPYASVAGSYSGLFYEDDQIRPRSAGFFTLLVSSRGTYSGRLQLGSGKYSFKGKLDLECRGTNWMYRKVGAALKLVLDLNGSGSQPNTVGALTDGSWVANLGADRNAAAIPSPLAGTYTIAIPGSDDGSGSMPEGHGYGTLRVDAAGKTKFAGVLADGTKITQSATISANGQWPLHASIYAGTGVVVSWMTFATRENDDIHGDLAWVKLPNALSRYYPAGFSMESHAVGSRYSPVPGNIMNLTSGTVQFSGGNVLSEFENSIIVGVGNKVANLSGNALSLSFSLGTGTFKGQVTDPGTGATSAFAGAVLPRMNQGFGFMLGTTASGRVELKP